MFLAVAWRLHRTELRADMQRYYGMDIERMGVDFTIWQAAACAVRLPLGSSLMAALDPRAQYTLTDYLLHRLGDMLAGKHLPYPWELETEKPVADFGTMPLEDFKRWHAAAFGGEGGENG